MLNNNQQIATLQILYSEQPQFPGDRFLQVRKWETSNGEQTDLIIEHGHLDDMGDLYTQCQIVPFYMALPEVLAQIDE